MGSDEIDSTQIPEVLRALKLNPSLASLEKLGTVTKKGNAHISIITEKLNVR